MFLKKKKVKKEVFKRVWSTCKELVLIIVMSITSKTKFRFISGELLEMNAILASECGYKCTLLRLLFYMHINTWVYIFPLLLVKWKAFPAYFQNFMRKVGYDINEI